MAFSILLYKSGEVKKKTKTMNKSGSYFKYFEKEELKILTLFDTVIGTHVPLRTKVAP